MARETYTYNIVGTGFNSYSYIIELCDSYLLVEDKAAMNIRHAVFVLVAMIKGMKSMSFIISVTPTESYRLNFIALQHHPSVSMVMSGW